MRRTMVGQAQKASLVIQVRQAGGVKKVIQDGMGRQACMAGKANQVSGVWISIATVFLATRATQVLLAPWARQASVDPVAGMARTVPQAPEANQESMLWAVRLGQRAILDQKDRQDHTVRQDHQVRQDSRDCRGWLAQRAVQEVLASQVAPVKRVSLAARVCKEPKAQRASGVATVKMASQVRGAIQAGMDPQASQVQLAIQVGEVCGGDRASKDQQDSKAPRANQGTQGRRGGKASLVPRANQADRTVSCQVRGASQANVDPVARMAGMARQAPRATLVSKVRRVGGHQASVESQATRASMGPQGDRASVAPLANLGQRGHQGMQNSLCCQSMLRCLCRK